MSDPSTIFFFLLLIFGALFVVSLVNQQQTRARIIAQRVVVLKRKAVELQEMAASLDTYVESAGISKTVLEECIDVLDGIDKLEKNNHFCQSHRTNVEQQIEQIMSSSSTPALYRAQASDSAIARAQYLINEAALIIRKRQAQEKLELVEMETFIHELAWANLMVTVITHIVQGHKAVSNGDVLKAYAFYKKGQQVLLKASISEEKRHKMIKQVGEIMSNKRKTLSADLMPETQHNPTGDTKELVAPPDQPT